MIQTNLSRGYKPQGCGWKRTGAAPSLNCQATMHLRLLQQVALQLVHLSRTTCAFNLLSSLCFSSTLFLSTEIRHIKPPYMYNTAQVCVCCVCRCVIPSDLASHFTSVILNVESKAHCSSHHYRCLQRRHTTRWKKNPAIVERRLTLVDTAPARPFQ